MATLLPATGAGTPNVLVETAEQIGLGKRQVTLANTAFPISSQELLQYTINGSGGGAATLIAQGPINGGFVVNPGVAAAQGLESAENLYISILQQPGNADADAFGPIYILVPGQTFVLNPLAAGYSVYVNAPTAGHQFAGEIW